MPLLKKELKRYSPLLPLSIAVLISLIVTVGNFQYAVVLNKFETTYIIIPAVLCCLLYLNNDEIDLIISSKTDTYVCLFSKVLSVYILSLFSVSCVLMALSLLFRTDMAIELLCILSFAVTSLFVVAVASLFRLLIRNPYASVTAVVVIVFFLKAIHSQTMMKKFPIQYLLVDPLISSDILADRGVWFVNKIIVFIISLIILWVCIMILKKDGLYNTSKT